MRLCLRGGGAADDGGADANLGKQQHCCFSSRGSAARLRLGDVTREEKQQRWLFPPGSGRMRNQTGPPGRPGRLRPAAEAPLFPPRCESASSVSAPAEMPTQTVRWQSQAESTADPCCYYCIRRFARHFPLLRYSSNGGMIHRVAQWKERSRL